MIKIKLLLLFILFVVVRVDAQTFRIDTTDVSFENKLRPCLHVTYDAPAKTVKKGWEDYMKRNYKIKIKGIGLFTDKDIIDAEDVTIHSIADKRMNMYAKVTDIPGGSEMKFFMSFGYDFFIGPDNYGKEFGSMHQLLNDFSVKFLNDFYGDEISSALKKIKGYERDIKKKNKEIGSNIKKSKNASDAVASGLEGKNNTLNLEIDRLQAKIKDIQEEIETIKLKQEGIIVK